MLPRHWPNFLPASLWETKKRNWHRCLEAAVGVSRECWKIVATKAVGKEPQIPTEPRKNPMATFIPLTTEAYTKYTKVLPPVTDREVPPAHLGVRLNLVASRRWQFHLPWIELLPSCSLFKSKPQIRVSSVMLESIGFFSFQVNRLNRSHPANFQISISLAQNAEWFADWLRNLL